MLTSPQKLPAERLQAARAAAAAMASSSVRCGYFAAALARAGNRGGYPQSAAATGAGSSMGDAVQHHGVAAAAVRLAAVHASAAAPEPRDTPEAWKQPSCNPTDSPRLTPPTPATSRAAVPEMAVIVDACERSSSDLPETSEDGAATPASSSDAAPGMSDMAETAEELRGTAPETPRRAPAMVWPATPEAAMTSSHASSSWQCFTWQRNAAATDISGVRKDSEDHRAEEVASATNAASNGDRATLGSIVVGPATEHEAVSDEAVANVWDVVVEKTFIAVVPRRQVLQHTASAPGCLSILGEAGIAVGRHRRQRSSRRRSRRRRATADQAASGNTVRLH